MAVTFDAASSNGSDTVGQTSISTTHTASGTNRYVIVGLSFRRETSDVSGISVSYDGVPMSQIGSIVGPGTNVSACAMFGLANPNTTAGATVSASWTNGQSWTEIGVVSFTGVLGGIGTPVTQVSANSSSPSVTVSSATGDMVIDTLATSGGTTATVGVGQTQRWNRSSATSFIGSGSTEPGGASVVMTWSLLFADQVNYMAVNLLGTAPATSGKNFPTLTLLGVG